MALANQLGKSSKPGELKRAVSLDPANPDLHFRLGMAEIYSLQESDPTQGTRQLEKATELSPREARYWRALASACEFEGDKRCAGRAISRALTLSPMFPRVHWVAANYYLWADDQSRAFRQFQRLLELDPSYARAAFLVTLRVAGSPERVYKQVLPATAGPKLQLAYVDFLVTQGHDHSAYQVWTKVAAGKPHLNFSMVNSYLKRLIESRHYEQADAVWHDLEHLGIVRQPAEPDPGNRVFNGGFEQIPLDAGFDWRYRQDPYVSVDFRAHHAYQGKYCLRLDFSDVENHQAEPVYEFVPVSPKQDYRLTAYVRSDNINSHSCPRLRVIDPAFPNCLSASSTPVTGTTPWHKITLSFQTGPSTHLVRLSVWRSRSLRYPTAILGTLWLDQVSIRAVGPVSDQVERREGA